MRIGAYGHVAENPNRTKAPWVIYYNQRCSKCRETLDLLRANRIDPQVIEYLDVHPTKKELEELLALLKVEPKAMIRTNEKIFRSLTVDLSDPQSVIGAILQHPELLERPIVVHEGKAIIARPPETVLQLLD